VQNASKVDIGVLYQQIVWPLAKIHGHAYKAFEKALSFLIFLVIMSHAHFPPAVLQMKYLAP
jgi:hypothetical protein